MVQDTKVKGELVFVKTNKANKTAGAPHGQVNKAHHHKRGAPAGYALGGHYWTASQQQLHHQERVMIQWNPY